MLWLPFQRRWLNDHSRLKILEKSRRIGGTYSTSKGVFDDLMKYKGHDVTVVTRDENLATEFVGDVTRWFRLWNAVRPVDAIDEKGFKRLSIEVPHKGGMSRLMAVSSNPNAAAGKGGSLVLDELALHKDPELLMRVAQPIIMAGGRMSVLSTHRSRNSKFNELVEKAREPDSEWSLHTTTIYDAVDQGLVEHIVNPTMIKLGNEPWATREAFIEWLKSTYDEFTFAQEFCCIPSDDACTLLSNKEIEDAKLKFTVEGHMEQGVNYLGYDCAESVYGDYAAVSVVRAGIHDAELLEPHYFPRGTPITDQLNVVEAMAKRYRVVKVVSDNVGIGRHPTTLLQDRLGESRVVPFEANLHTKAEMCVKVKRYFQNGWFRMQADKQVELDFLSIDRTITPAGNVVYTASRRDNAHGDMFSATAMAMTEIPEKQMADVKGVKANDAEAIDSIMKGGQMSIRDRIERNKRLDAQAKRKFTY